MVFELQQNIIAKDGTVWVAQGTYPIVGLFDNERILINVGKESRQLVVVALKKGKVYRHGNKA
jgi:hypothetical protein